MEQRTQQQHPTRRQVWVGLESPLPRPLTSVLPTELSRDADANADANADADDAPVASSTGAPGRSTRAGDTTGAAGTAAAAGAEEAVREHGHGHGRAPNPCRRGRGAARKKAHTSAPSAVSSSGSSAGPCPILSAADEAILRLLAIYHFLLADQVRRLRGYRPGSLDFVRAALKRLVERAFVVRLRLPRASAGNAPWVYTVSQQGYSYLAAATARFGTGDDAGFDAGAGADAGLDADALVEKSKRFRPAETYERSYLFLTHTLAVNDFLIAAALLSRQTPDVVLVQMRHERDLKRAPVRVTLGHVAIGSDSDRQFGQQQHQGVAVIPDGWLDFHIKGAAQLCVALELDRGTEEEYAFKRKLRALLAYAAGPYQTAFGTDSLTVAFATTAGTRRAERMRVWCEQVLRTEQQEQEADLFYVTSLPEGELDPQTVFLAPIWARPFANDRVPLVEL